MTVPSYNGAGKNDLRLVRPLTAVATSRGYAIPIGDLPSRPLTKLDSFNDCSDLLNNRSRKKVIKPGATPQTTALLSDGKTPDLFTKKPRFVFIRPAIVDTHNLDGQTKLTGGGFTANRNA